MAGLLDLLKKEGGQYLRDIMPGGILNPEWTPERTQMALSGLLDVTPVVGDIKSGYEGVQAARQGDMVGAGLGALGALPFVPNMAGVVEKRINPKFFNEYGGVDLYKNPTEPEFLKLLSQSRRDAKVRDPQASGSVRFMRDDKTGEIYAIDGNKALHKDMTDSIGVKESEVLKDEAFNLQDFDRIMKFWNFKN